MKAKTFFLWPEPEKLYAADFLGEECSHELIELQLRELFPGAEPVLFSSARAGLTAVLHVLELSRPNLVWVPPFSSHCVLEAVAHVGTPVTVRPQGEPLAAALVYHQWGHVNTPVFTEEFPIIEDCVDTLLVPGSSPFAAGGEFALWSLPKVIGTRAGGVVFCRHAGNADQLRRIRDERGQSVLQAVLRTRAKASRLVSLYWNGAEAMSGGLVGPLRRQINRKLRGLNRIVDERFKVIAEVSSGLARNYIKRGRLPSNLPLQVPKGWEGIWGADRKISSGLRSFNAAGRWPLAKWTKVAPLPVHLDVSAHDMRDILSQVGVAGLAGQILQPGETQASAELC